MLRSRVVKRVVGLLTCVGLCAGSVQAADLRVGAAADLRAPVRELTAAFERLYPDVRVQLTFAPPETLAARVAADTSFDVLVTADSAGAAKLEKSELLVRGGRTTFAYGRLALWARKPAAKYVPRAGLVTLATAEVLRVAMPNPSSSSYGRAAQAALDRAKLWSQVKPKCVYADDDATAAEMALATTQAAMLSRGAAEQPAMKRAGKVWVLPDSLGRPIPHVACVVTGADSVAGAFVGFLRVGAARELLGRHGLSPAGGR